MGNVTTPHRLPQRGSLQRAESRRGRFDRQSLDLLREIDARWRFSPSVSWFVLAVLIVGLCLKVGGFVMATVSIPLALLIPACVARLVASRRRHSIADHLADFCTDIARGVRAGQTLPEALDAAVALAPNHVPSGAIVAMSEHRTGRPFDLAIESWAASASTPAETLVASALSIGVVAGGHVGLSLDLMSEAVAAELHAAQRRHTVTAQARYSARVLTGLPVGVAVLVGIGTDSGMYGRSSVWIALGLGVLMASLGWTWMMWQIGRVT